ncbi:MAG: VCBS repeat-containing protein [Acidobacteriota bacterium]
MKKSSNKWEKHTILGTTLFLVIGFITVGISSVKVQANNTAQTLPFSQNWTNAGLITTNDDWSAVPGIVGYRGDDAATTASGIDPRTILADRSTPINVIANQANPDTLTTGGVAEFDGITNPTIALQGSGTADAPHIVVSLNTTGQSNIKFTANIRDIDGSGDDTVQPIDVQYRVGGTGDYTSVPGGYIADATTGPNLATLVTPLNLTLPAAADNKPLVEVRVITTNSPSSDEWVGVDDINVTAAGSTTPPTAKSTLYDFTGNGRTDWTTLTIPTSGSITWNILQNPAAGTNNDFIRIFNYGLRTGANSGDAIVPRDYSGDKKSEVAVWRPGSQGVFYVSQIPTGTAGIMLERAVPFGVTGDNPNAIGDYDGDGKTDYAVSRGFTWYIINSSTNTFSQVTFGPAPGTAFFIVVNGADFNGDGRDEVVFLSLDSTQAIPTWYAGDAVTGAGVFSRQFGDFSSDFVVTPADYTGDGIADLVAIRQASAGQVWYISNTATAAVTATVFGISNDDVQVRGDYDGDGRQDIAVWRPENQTFYYISSANGSIGGQKWGNATDTPLGSFGIF